MIKMDYFLLNKINSPQDLRLLPQEQLEFLCEEIREYLLECVSQSSGHLASGLGVVELSVALHYVYNTPFDHIIWDVGHQAYPHKILTGRRDQMSTIRKKDGIHPFPWREESIYDVLSVGHSSTSISAGVGLAIAAEKENKNRQTVCIIGDGAITAGMAFEALNHAGHLKSNMLVILNDNNMSISKNIGALNQNLAQLFSGKLYSSIREKSKHIVSNIDPLKHFLKKTEENLKGFVSPGTLFQELGFNYIGPIDGHNLSALIHILNNIKSLNGPQFLHILTKKGKGYAPAEADPVGWHGVPTFDRKQGKLPLNNSSPSTYSTIFGNWLCETAKTDPNLVAITPAMSEGSGMKQFELQFPERFFDVAIAEQHAITLAAGLAIGGLKPVVAIYSTFLQRGYDQIIHDIALQKLPVLFAIDRAGIVGEDGATHQGAFDLSYLRCIPNLMIMTPSNEHECKKMLSFGYQSQFPAAVRYPRGSVINLPQNENHTEIQLGKAQIHRLGKKIAILNFGTRLNEALIAADKLNATVIDMRFVKPIDEQIIRKMLDSHELLVTIEENVIKGGAGSAVNEFVVSQKNLRPVLNLGFPDKFIEQGNQKETLSELNLDANGIFNKISEKIHELT